MNFTELACQSDLCVVYVSLCITKTLALTHTLKRKTEVIEICKEYRPQIRSEAADHLLSDCKLLTYTC